LDIIYWLIPLTVVILAIAIAIFFWAVKDGQFNDLDSPAVNILFDDDLAKPLTSKLSKQENNQEALSSPDKPSNKKD